MTRPPDALVFEEVDATTWDAVVIGAGPAGALAARLLALGGARVLLVERARFPRWKVCGACLNGQALAALGAAGLGSLVDRLGGVGLDECLVGLGGRTTPIALTVGAAVSRARFDAALVEEARLAGADVLMETQAAVDAVRDGARHVRLVHEGGTARVAARVVVAAGGLGNLAMERDARGPRSRVAAGSRIGAGCLVGDAPSFYHKGTIFMAVGRAGYVGLVRVEDEGLNVAAAFEQAFLRSFGTLAAAAAAVLVEAGFPTVEALDRAAWRGTPGLTRRTWPLAEERLFLIGDAAGYVEPFTGEGIAWALASARAIAPLAIRAVEGWTPRLANDWADLHGRLVRRRQWVCRGLATVLRRPWLARSAFEVAASVPGAARFVLRRLNEPAFPRRLEMGRP
jgi:menaquinone-9 beta-reductase